MSGWVNPFNDPPTDAERRETVIATTGESLLRWFGDVISLITEDDGPLPMNAVVARDWVRGVVLTQFERNPLMPVVVPIDLAREVADHTAFLFLLHFRFEQVGHA